MRHPKESQESERADGQDRADNNRTVFGLSLFTELEYLRVGGKVNDGNSFFGYRTAEKLTGDLRCRGPCVSLLRLVLNREPVLMPALAADGFLRAHDLRRDNFSMGLELLAILVLSNPKYNQHWPADQHRQKYQQSLHS